MWDRSASVSESLAGAGAMAAASARQAVRDARVVITMLPTADVVNSVVFDGGVADAFARGVRVGADGHHRCGGNHGGP